MAHPLYELMKVVLDTCGTAFGLQQLGTRLLKTSGFEAAGEKLAAVQQQYGWTTDQMAVDWATRMAFSLEEYRKLLAQQKTSPEDFRRMLMNLASLHPREWEAMCKFLHLRPTLLPPPAPELTVEQDPLVWLWQRIQHYGQIHHAPGMPDMQEERLRALTAYIRKAVADRPYVLDVELVTAAAQFGGEQSPEELIEALTAMAHHLPEEWIKAAKALGVVPLMPTAHLTKTETKIADPFPKPIAQA